MMTDDEAKQWAVALIEVEVQRHIAELDSHQLVGFEDAPDWPDETEDLIVELIDTATCTIEVDWPPRPKARVGA